jgi:hypothetical protein
MTVHSNFYLGKLPETAWRKLDSWITASACNVAFR